ncbi:MAG: hypothetical protein U9N46_09125 [Euryarchaeota archaeon]|nr:hypothetical protein [Euryarchaeota archaeon]
MRKNPLVKSAFQTEFDSDTVMRVAGLHDSARGCPALPVSRHGDARGFAGARVVGRRLSVVVF